MSAPLLPASQEVLDEHALRHMVEHHSGVDSIPVDIAFCPCSQAAALICGACDELLFVGWQSGSWCEHAEELHEYMRRAQP